MRVHREGARLRTQTHGHVHFVSLRLSHQLCKVYSKLGLLTWVKDLQDSNPMLAFMHRLFPLCSGLQFQCGSLQFSSSKLLKQPPSNGPWASAYGTFTVQAFLSASWGQEAAMASHHPKEGYL